MRERSKRRAVLIGFSQEPGGDGVGRRRTGAAMIAAMALSAAVFPARAQEAPVTQREVVSGVEYRLFVRPEGPWRIHVIDADLRTPGLSLRSIRAFDRLQGRETTSSMAARYPDSLGRVVAAVNADFFSLESGETTNNQVIDGEWVKGLGGSRPRPRSQFGLLSSGRPIIDRLKFEGWVISSQSPTVPLHAVNASSDSISFALITRYARPPDATGVYRSGSTVALARFWMSGDTTMAIVGRSCDARDSLWLVAGHNPRAERRLADYHTGDTLKLVLRSQPYRGHLATLVGGTPRIVVNGQNVAGVTAWMEGTAEGFVTRRHPRTGIGISRDSTHVLLFVVDGRQASSDGMTLKEFADLMIESGVFQGVNLDGGGSSTMIVEGTVVNSPSDSAGEREVGNALLLVTQPLSKQTQ
jgi:hypothetical protein